MPTGPAVVDVAHQLDDVGLGPRGGDRVEVGFQRLDAARLDGGFVHPGVVEVDDLLLHRAGDGRRRASSSSSVRTSALGLVAQRVEHAIAGLVSRHRERRDPLAVDVFVKVVAGLHRGVHRRGIDAERAEGRSRRGSGCRSRCRGLGSSLHAVIRAAVEMANRKGSLMDSPLPSLGILARRATAARVPLFREPLADVRRDVADLLSSQRAAAERRHRVAAFADDLQHDGRGSSSPATSGRRRGRLRLARRDTRDTRSCRPWRRRRRCRAPRCAGENVISEPAGGTGSSAPSKPNSHRLSPRAEPAN